MRQSCHWVTTSCAAPLTSGKKYVAVHLLSKEILYSIVEVKGKVQHVFDQLCSYLGLKDAELFGLALLLDNEYLFLDFNIKLSKLASKSWKSQSNNGLDSIGRPLLALHVGIQYYVDCPLLVRDKQTRHHYYLQVKGNFIQHCQVCSEERCFLMAAYALQADYGNFREDKHVGRYFEPRDYFPPWILTRLGDDYIIQNAPKIHKDYLGYSKGEAELAFIREASSPDAPHNLQIYKLKKKKNDLLGSVWLGICSRGIEIYESGGVSSPTKKLMATFLWADIGKLCFEKKKFEIRAASYSDSRKYTYYTGSDEKSKHLLYLCKATHQFNLAIQPRVMEFRRLEQEEKKSYRESYIYSDSQDLEWEQEHCMQLDMSLHDFNTLSKKTKVPCDQRTSVISNASSNTTSGIVSDRVQSLDGSEDETDSAREPDSPLPPSDQPIEALNLAVINSLGFEGCRQEDDVSTPRKESVLGETSKQLMNGNCPKAEMEAAVDSAHSSGSSERSVSTVRSKLAAAAALVKSTSEDPFNRPLPIGYSTVAASTPSVSSSSQLSNNLATHHFSESTSDTCSSSFDHSYTSSVDSGSAQATYLNGGIAFGNPWLQKTPHRYAASSLQSISSTDDLEWRTDIGKTPFENNVQYLPTSPTGCTSPASTSSSAPGARPLRPPPVPVRTEHSMYYGRNGSGVLTNTSIRSSPSCSPQSSNDETSVNYLSMSSLGVGGVGGYTYPPTCLPGGRTSAGRFSNGFGVGHYPAPTQQHCRTKIGISSLSRNPANLNGFGSGGGGYHHRRPLSLHAPSTMHPQYMQQTSRYLYGGHSNLVTLGKSISVPNVINENECLSLGCNGGEFGGLGSSMATYPQMVSGAPMAGTRNGYYAGASRMTSVPTYSHLAEEIATVPPSTSNGYSLAGDGGWMSPMSDGYTRGSYSELSPIPPPSDFATFIPPPPPYRIPQGCDDSSLSSCTSLMTPPPGFRHDQSPPPPLPELSTSTTPVGPPLVRPRGLHLPVKAVSEENLLSSNQQHTGFPMINFLLGNSASSVHLNGYHSEDSVEGKLSAMSPSPPPYCAEVSPVPSSRMGSTETSSSHPASPGSPGSSTTSRSQEEGLDFQTLKERSKDLDLPLITALCNDRSLIPVSNACCHQHMAGVTDVRRLSCCAPVTIYAKTTSTGRPMSWHVDSSRSVCDTNGAPLSLASGAPWWPRPAVTAGAVPASTAVAHSNGNILPPTPLTRWSSANVVLSNPPALSPQLSVGIMPSLITSSAAASASGAVMLPSYGLFPVTSVPVMVPAQHRIVSTNSMVSNGFANVASLN